VVYFDSSEKGETIENIIEYIFPLYFAYVLDDTLVTFPILLKWAEIFFSSLQSNTNQDEKCWAFTPFSHPPHFSSLLGAMLQVNGVCIMIIGKFKNNFTFV